MCVFGPTKPIIKIDSYKTERKNVQCITNIINIAIEPCEEHLGHVENFIHKNAQFFDQKNLEILSKCDRIQKMK